MTKLLLVRHGQSEYNVANRFAGVSDIDLTEVGRQQVQKVRHRLASERIDAVYSSDLKRAQSTVQAIIDGRNLTVNLCPELREIDYGDVEGLPFSQIQTRYPELAKQMRSSEMEMQFPGGESFGQLVERVTKFKEMVSKRGASENVLVVSHGGPLRALVCSMLGIDQRCWWQIGMDNASLSIIDIYSRGAILSLLNGTYHLKELRD